MRRIRARYDAGEINRNETLYPWTPKKNAVTTVPLEPQEERCTPGPPRRTLYPWTPKKNAVTTVPLDPQEERCNYWTPGPARRTL
ncbi:hypothetical protein ACOMHN_058339 [Nucella lapillus]